MLVSTEVKRYGSESCHAYDREGNPQHFVPYKDKKRKGEMRPTTLRDIKERGWYPSVSAILGVVEKKGLDGWKKEQVALASWDAPRHYEKEDYVKEVLSAAESRMTKARDLGTEIHGAIERYLEDYSIHWEDATPLGHYEAVNAARNALRELGVWGQPFSAERTFASPMGYGGTVDVMEERKHFLPRWYVDFKCVDRLDKKLTYDDRCAQLCGYCIGAPGQLPVWDKEGLIKETRLANIFISTSDPGKYLIHEWSMDEKEHGWQLFEASFALWKIVNRYDPLSVTSS